MDSIMIAKIVADAINKPARPMCGACKATGIAHEWNAKAGLVPVPHKVCPNCNGTGYFMPKPKITARAALDKPEGK